ncbi:MAG: flavin reductase family protein [Alistipes sp.]|jgi:flavin reductase (DIM6/NTAB) family NADH-FMN oxidoreductase RutF|nr:flavin reductase family protein [Alistipes sp.]
MKKSWKPGTMIYPIPAVMVSCGAEPEEHNIITVAWTGTICSEPAMCYVSIRPERHSYDIIKRTGEFVINLTTEALAEATDWCGVRSGRDFDKFSHCGLTPEKCAVVAAPAIAEAPVSIECRVKQIIPLGSHDMFIGEVVNVLVDESLLDPQSGKLDLQRSRLLCYAHGEYFGLGERLGTFGWTVKGSTRKKEMRRTTAKSTKK